MLPLAQAAKAAVQKTFSSSTTAQFRRFFASPLFDRLARACIQHFLARFEHDLLLKAGTAPPPGASPQHGTHAVCAECEDGQ
jgi:hypothetical protein